MEVLSGVASGMAVASLSIQLVDSIIKIRDFILDVKGASKELIRLANLLDQLKSLLEDVSNLMERQASLQQQCMPAPPATIVAALGCCQASIEALSDIVEKYRRSQQSSSSSIAKLKDELRFGLKTKDVVALEERIQRDYQCLFMALQLNDTNILITVLPRLLDIRREPRMYSSQRVGTSLVGPNMRSELEASNICSESKSSKLIRRRRQPAPIPTMINILQMSIVSTRGSQEVITYEDDTVDEVYLSTTNHRKILVTWRSIGYGFQWQSRYPYGSVLPSLRVFPITESMRKYQYIIENSSLYEIQKMFHSGQMHPFTQDVRGRTLLHVAAAEHRADICRILAKYGAPYSVDKYGHSPLTDALWFMSGSDVSDRDMHIDVLRTLLFDFEHPDEPVRVATAIAPSTCVLDWLWTSAEAVYHGHGLTNVRTTLLLSYLNRSSYSYTNKAPDQELYSQQKSFLEKSLVSYYASGRSGLLRYLFKCNRSHSYHSSEVGSWFIHHLSQLGLNVTECLERENKTIRRGLLRKDNIRYRNDRKVTFQRAHGQAWSISWEWSYDPLAPGYHLVSEFNALAADSDYTLAKDLCWPFSERRATYCFDYSCDCCKPSSMRQDCMEPYERHWERAAIRFQVRMAARARKYQKLARKHLPRPEMPGSWKW